jgi:hypothetical protein
MSTANDSLLYTLALAGFPVTDDVALSSTAQATAAPVIGDLARVVTSVANGAMMLKSSVSGEAPPICFVVNDSANAVKVFPFVGESLNGTANNSLSIPSGQSGVFIRVPPQIAKGGGGGGTIDWRSAVIP